MRTERHLRVRVWMAKQVDGSSMVQLRKHHQKPVVVPHRAEVTHDEVSGRRHMVLRWRGSPYQTVRARVAIRCVAELPALLETEPEPGAPLPPKELRETVLLFERTVGPARFHRSRR